jgi:hypothetical protein
MHAQEGAQRMWRDKLHLNMHASSLPPVIRLQTVSQADPVCPLNLQSRASYPPQLATKPHTAYTLSPDSKLQLACRTVC